MPKAKRCKRKLYANPFHVRCALESLEPRIALTAAPLISEFMASNSQSLVDGDGDSADWIEVHNPSTGTIDLNGWFLTDNAAEPTKWPFPGITLDAGDYLVVFASGQERPDYRDPDGNLHTNFKLSAGGEFLALVDAQQAIVSQYSPTYPPQSTDVSYGLASDGNVTYLATSTPGFANAGSEQTSDAIVINEIMYHPGSGNPNEEYIELHNRSDNAVNLNGWSFDAGVAFTFPAISVSPGGFLAVAANTDRFAQLYPDVPNLIGNWSGALADGGERIRLTTEDGRIADQVDYADEGQWADRERGPLDYDHEGWIWSNEHDGGGKSLELITPNSDNAWGQNWGASQTEGGSPGRSNTRLDAEQNAAPVILDVRHAPAIPSSTDPIVVTAHLIDTGPDLLQAVATYRVDGDAPEFSSVPMQDDGLGRDLQAGDGIYTAVIPPQIDQAIVEWYVFASDNAGNTRSWPAPTQPAGVQQTNLLLQVDDSFDLPMELAQQFPSYRLIMTETERAELQQIGSNSREGNSHAQMNATFISIAERQVETRYQVGVRNRGRGSRSRLPNSYHVNIPSDTPWQGVNEFNLNTQHTHLQLLGLKLYADAGIESEDGKPIQLQVNGNDLSSVGAPSYGIYAQIESPGTDFTRNHFPEDSGGNLYRVSREGSDSRGELRFLGDDPDLYKDNYEKKTNQAADDYSDILKLIDRLNSPDQENYLDRVRTVIDVDQWLTYFATTAILATRETTLGTGHGDDFFLYAGEKDPRFRVIPHDLDAILGEGESSNVPTDGIYQATRMPALERFLTDPAIAPQYHEKLASLLKTTFSKSSFDALVNETLEPIVSQEKRTQLIDFMDARRTFIQSQIVTPLTAQTGLPTHAGVAFTNQPTIGISGTAPLIGTRAVLVAGQPASLAPFTGQWNLGEATSSLVREILPAGQTWDYLDGGRVPGTDGDWRIDDPGWLNSGPAPLGYGGDEATEVAFVDTDPDEAGTQKNITTYFRHVFNATNVDTLQSLTLQLQRDDGAIVYLNGQEVVRDNLPEGDIGPTTTALETVGGSDETTFTPRSLAPALLREGENVLAVEIHQRSPGSSDISFDLSLQGTTLENGGTGPGVTLSPGLNSLPIQAFDRPDASGKVLDTTVVDIWYEANQSLTEIGGELRQDSTLTREGSPYLVTEDIVVLDGTLTIEPGVTLLFEADTGISITNTGRIVAVGQVDQRIRMMHNPRNLGASWQGLTVSDTDTENLFQHVDFRNGDAQGNAVSILHGRVTFDDVKWTDIDNQVIDMRHPKLIVRNSLIPGISDDETIHLVGFDEGDILIFEGNTFGKNTSGGDVIDMGPDSTSRETIYFRDNVFLGGLDDGIDTDGMRVVFENNFFTDFHLESSRRTTSNAISTGHQNVAGTRLSSELTITGNTFFDVDHSLLLKDFGFATFTNNTVVRATVGGIQFQELQGSNVIGPGLGAVLDGNIFWETPQTFEAIHPDTQLTVRRSLVNPEWVSAGFGNLADDPHFVDAAFHLAADSPARGIGPYGADLGANQFVDLTPASSHNLEITELHYHPRSGDERAPQYEVPASSGQFEFVELRNSSSNPIDLAGVAFVNGVSFQFQAGQSLTPGERAVIVKDEGIFRSRYGQAPNVLGEFTGQFDNDGETITLVGADGQIITSFTYQDAAATGWPESPDGSGDSLVVLDPTGDLDAPSNWTASRQPGGTPAHQTPAPFVSSTEFRYQTDLALSLSFSQPVDLTQLSEASFMLTNLTTGTQLGIDQIDLLRKTPEEIELVIAPSRAEQNGDWRITLAPQTVQTPDGITSNTTYQFDFFILAGDYNRDRSVDAADFTVWRDTVGSSDLRANGDRTGDSASKIDFGDFLVLSANYGLRL